MDDHKNERFFEADFGGAWFHGVNFSNVKISDAMLFNVDISGLVANLSINGVDVTGYVEGELNQRHPERVLLAPSDPDGMRAAWQSIEEFSTATLVRARALPPAKLDESVAEEWSFLETLRHLVFATDRWITGPVLDDPKPFHPLGMPNPPHDEIDIAYFDFDAKPSLDEVLAVRRERMNRLAEQVHGIDAAELARAVQNPNGGTTTVMSCLHIVFREEWWHDQYANRDLAILERHDPHASRR
jgi:DinB superfamily/Pentapeptide repeats (8 copies)